MLIVRDQYLVYGMDEINTALIEGVSCLWGRDKYHACRSGEINIVLIDGAR